MANTLTLKTNSGDQTYIVEDLSFVNLACDLEAKGIDVMALTNEGVSNGKTMTTIRAILAVVIGTDEKSAGVLLSQHLKNGGNFDDIMNAFAGAMQEADFGQAQTTQNQPIVTPGV